MSAHFCGCDPEAGWTCLQHLETPIEMVDSHQMSVVQQANQTARRLLEAADALRLVMQSGVSTIDTLIGERAHIADVLATFYRAELSISSVQPILDLAVKLNPELSGTPALTAAAALRNSETPTTGA